MLPISQDELDSARSEFTGLMNTTATRKVATRNEDGRGGGHQIYVAVGTFQCALCPASRGRTMGREVVEAERNASIIDWTVVCPFGTEVDVKDRLTIDGEDYEIQGVDDDRTDQMVLALNVRRLR